MSDQIDWCKYFRDIEENPSATTPRLTVRQFYFAKEHLFGCDVCNNRVERVLARAPKDELPRSGQN